MKNILENNVIAKNIPMLCLITVATVITFIFIERYCELFNELGFMAKERLLNKPILAFFITPTFFWVSAYLCRKFAIDASGNSMEHLRESLEKSKKDPENFAALSNLLGARTIIIKTVSSLLCTFGGGALGREGPAVHMSAGIFAIIGDRFKAFLPRINFETWILAGSATGMAIAFHAPISGFVFAVEKLSKSKSPNFLANIVWILSATLVMVAILSYYEPIFIVAAMNFMLFKQLSLLILTSVVCGLLAFLFKKINKYFYLKFSSIKSNLWHLIPISAGLIVASVSLYSGIHSFSGGIYTADEALLSSNVLLSYKEVGGRVINTIVSFVSGCAGGLVAPAVAIGAGIGSLTSILMPSTDANIFLIIGMAAFLGAALGESVTAAIIIFEITTQSVTAIPFLLASSTISLWVAKGTDEVFIWLRKFFRAS